MTGLFVSMGNSEVIYRGQPGLLSWLSLVIRQADRNSELREHESSQ